MLAPDRNGFQRDAAPHVDARIFWRPLVRVKLLAQYRVDAFRADDDAAALRGQLLAVDVLKMRDCLRPVVLDLDAAPTGDHLVRTGALNECIEQDHLQITAMDRELRHVVTRKLAGRLAVDVLAEAVIEAIFARGDGDLCKCILEPEGAQLARRVRKNVDADTNGLEFRRRLKDPAGNAGAMQHQAQSQAADAGADNQNFHDDQFLLRIRAGPLLPRNRPRQAPSGDACEE